MDLLDGTSTDASMLAALIRSPKVLVMEDLQPREEACWPFAEDGDISRCALPSHLHDLKSLPEGPPEALQRLGQRTLVSGLLLAIGGAGMQVAEQHAGEGTNDENLVAGTRYR
ncbi:unnamed protein product [Durusdinium trenchii]